MPVHLQPLEDMVVCSNEVRHLRDKQAPVATTQVSFRSLQRETLGHVEASPFRMHVSVPCSETYEREIGGSQTHIEVQM